MTAYQESYLFRKNTYFIKSLCITALLGAGTAFAGPITYVHDAPSDPGNGRLGTLDVKTGEVSIIGNTGVELTDIAVDSSGSLWGTSFTNLYQINENTATATSVGNYSKDINGMNALAFGNNGDLYAADATTSNLYTLDTLDGSETSLGDMGFYSAGDLEFNANSLYLSACDNAFFSNTQCDDSSLVNVVANTPSDSTKIGSLGVDGMYGLATAGNNDNLYGVAGSSVYSVSTSTGAATNGVAFSGATDFVAGGQASYKVPEPNTAFLLTLGLLGLAQRKKILS